MPTGIPTQTYYRTGLDGKMIKNLDEIAQDVKDHRNPAIILIAGYLNRAKTTSATRCCEYIQKNFDETKQVGVGISGFIEAYQNTIEMEKTPGSKCKCVIFDEPSEYMSSGGNRKLIGQVNKILDTIKHHQVMIFICSPSFWELNMHIYKLGAVRGLIHLTKIIPNKWAEYAFYDARTTLRIVGECRKAEKNYQIDQAMYVAYRKYLSRGAPIRGRFKAPTKKRQDKIDKNSDEGKNFMQQKVFSKLEMED